MGREKDSNVRVYFQFQKKEKKTFPGDAFIFSLIEPSVLSFSYLFSTFTFL